MRARNRNILKVMVSLVVSVAAGYLAMRGVRFREVVSGFWQADFGMIAFAALLCLAAQVGRSYRWGLVLEPLQPVSQRLLLPITSIGFLFVWVLPARIGEVARPYLLCQNSEVGLSAAMGSVVLERLLDACFLVCVLLVCLTGLQVPGWVLTSVSTFIFLLLSVLLLMLLGSLPWSRNRFGQLAVFILPKKVGARLTQSVDTFYSGMRAVASFRRMLGIIGLTLVIWGLGVVSVMVLLNAMGLRLSWLAATAVLAFTSLGIALPAAPGFIGSFHYAAVLALSLFGVARDKALAVAILFHFVVAMVIVLMGILFFNISRLKKSFSWRQQDNLIADDAASEESPPQ